MREPTRRMLVSMAHPDDESSKGAGTVARYADAGVRSILVTATGGEAGDILNPAMDRPGVSDDLPAIRRGELEEAARILGYEDVVWMGHRDSGMPDSADNRHPGAFCNQPHEVVLEQLVGVVRRYRPERARRARPDGVRIQGCAHLGRAVARRERAPQRRTATG